MKMKVLCVTKEYKYRNRKLKVAKRTFPERVESPNDEVKSYRIYGIMRLFNRAAVLCSCQPTFHMAVTSRYNVALSVGTRV